MKDPTQTRPSTAALRAVYAAAAAILVVLAATQATQATARPPALHRRAQGLVLPTTTADVRVDAESLTIDFGEMNYGAQVEARYELANVTARPVSLDVLFIALQGNEPVVTLGGERLPVTGS